MEDHHVLAMARLAWPRMYFTREIAAGGLCCKVNEDSSEGSHLPTRRIHERPLDGYVENLVKLTSVPETLPKRLSVL